MDSTIARIVNKALDNSLLSEAETAELLRVEDYSDEAFAIRMAGRRYAQSFMGGKAEIHGQTGINSGPCPMECQFCSFAASNGAFTENVKLPLEQVVENVEKLVADGCNAIYLMTTVQYPFEEYLEVGAAAMKAIAGKAPLIANVGDFNEEQARALKDVGFAGVYHVIRMGEGEFTRIPVKRRLATMEAAHSAGLVLGSCVEPIGPEHTVEEIAEKTILTRETSAIFSGAMRRTPIAGSPLAKHGIVSYARMATIVAAVALATGPAVIGNCTHEPNQLAAYNGANLLWAEVGSNPRDTEASTVRGWTAERCRELLGECDWDVLDGPSQMFD
jgi:biotin synthase